MYHGTVYWQLGKGVAGLTPREMRAVRSYIAGAYEKNSSMFMEAGRSNIYHGQIGLGADKVAVVRVINKVPVVTIHAMKVIDVPFVSKQKKKVSEVDKTVVKMIEDTVEGYLEDVLQFLVTVPLGVFVTSDYTAAMTGFDDDESKILFTEQETGESYSVRSGGGASAIVSDNAPWSRPGNSDIIGKFYISINPKTFELTWVDNSVADVLHRDVGVYEVIPWRRQMSVLSKYDCGVNREFTFNGGFAVLEPRYQVLDKKSCGYFLAAKSMAGYSCITMTEQQHLFQSTCYSGVSSPSGENVFAFSWANVIISYNNGGTEYFSEETYMSFIPESALVYGDRRPGGGMWSYGGDVLGYIIWAIATDGTNEYEVIMFSGNPDFTNPDFTMYTWGIDTLNYLGTGSLNILESDTEYNCYTRYDLTWGTGGVANNFANSNMFSESVAQGEKAIQFFDLCAQGSSVYYCIDSTNCYVTLSGGQVHLVDYEDTGAGSPPSLWWYSDTIGEETTVYAADSLQEGRITIDAEGKIVSITIAESTTAVGVADTYRFPE